ncbi:MAG TPA: hypothetical protein PLG97_02630 [Alcaligenes sp.]|nr:hypothetical protein [Alcaligenes sp.]HRL26391.1 hypothetical protein [Alcaligenes sp.]
MGIISAIFPSYRWVRFCQLGIILALAALLLNLSLPTVTTIPPVLEDPPTERAGTEQLALWFGGSTALPELRLHGMITGAGNGAALLSINQQPVLPYRQGQELAPGVILDSLQREHITITVDGVPQTIATQHPAPLVSAGIGRLTKP